MFFIFSLADSMTDIRTFIHFKNGICEALHEAFLHLSSISQIQTINVKQMKGFSTSNFKKAF